MHRRTFGRHALLAGLAGHPLLSRADGGAPAAAAWEAIEAASQGRLGVAVLDGATGTLDGHRLDERFPMCSTFKWLAGAHVLHRVDQGQDRLDRRIRFGREVLLPYSPVTELHLDDGMTLAELCQAAIATSDNAAGNLVLQALGGPQRLTAHARGLGDAVTRLDRWEPDLNQALPGDPRDTSSPRAMAHLLRVTVLGDALSPSGRARLADWLQATRTNRQRLAAGLPPGWQVGSKTGTGAYGTTNDVGVYWPAGRPPVVVAVFLTGSAASLAVREAAIAAVARAVVRTTG